MDPARRRRAARGAGSAPYPFLAPGNATVFQQPVELSFERDQGCSPFGNLGWTVIATDDGGNVDSVTPYSWSPACF